MHSSLAVSLPSLPRPAVFPLSLQPIPLNEPLNFPEQPTDQCISHQNNLGVCLPLGLESATCNGGFDPASLPFLLPSRPISSAI